MENEIVISLKNVSKTFHAKRRSGNTIRERVLGLFTNRVVEQNIYALQNINIDIRKGETFGIVGRNGSGKSTLIHLIMGSMRPDKGSHIETKGVMMRLSLGMGMDKNLSARDNIYVNGSILGLSFKQIGTIFYDILDFAGLREFVDIPIKNYSKGMKARLNFSIAMYANADIFLLDEFFGGVGDKDFKKKSDKAFKDQLLKGKTIVIVSHDLGTIKKFCDRAIWINKGVPEIVGPSEDVVNAYKESFKKTESHSNMN